MLAVFFSRAPSYFSIACCVSLDIVAASLIYSLNYEPGTPLGLTDAVLADHPATPIIQRLIEERCTDEEIFRHPEVRRILNEYLGMEYLNTKE